MRLRVFLDNSNSVAGSNESYIGYIRVTWAIQLATESFYGAYFVIQNLIVMSKSTADYYTMKDTHIIPKVNMYCYHQ